MQQADLGLTEAEIASQPDCWRQAAALLPEVSGLLPAPGERVAVVGCGTSSFIAQCYAVAREAAGLGETDAFAASEMQGWPPVRPGGDAVPVQSTTTEILRLLDVLGDRQPTVAITADARTPISSAADAIRSRWTSPTSGRWSRPGSPPRNWRCCSRPIGTDLGPVAAAAERVLAGPLPEVLTRGLPVHLPRHRVDRRPGQRGGVDCASRLGCGRSRIRRWSTGTGRSRSPDPGAWCGCWDPCRTGWPMK